MCETNLLPRRPVWPLPFPNSSCGVWAASVYFRLENCELMNVSICPSVFEKSE